MLLVSVAFIIGASSLSHALDTLVVTQLGSVQGWTGQSRDGREYRAFTKIPFAKPPVGTLRFRNPVPFGQWDGVLNATKNLPRCVQRASRSNPNSSHGIEDCLYLSIYVPKAASEKLPVLFYIHGGAFQTGHPGGRRMADFIMGENVVLVATTYRLNLFGFLSLEDENIPGNFGLKDQAMALRWVKDNIESFGGDSKRIVIFGESAGGASVHHLLISPLTKDLINGAVSISGTIGPWSLGSAGELRNTSVQVATALGCHLGPDQAVLSCLQNVSLEQLVKQVPLGMSELGKIRFKPCVEPKVPGAVIPANPIDASLTAPRSPWIVSFTNGEYLQSYPVIKSVLKKRKGPLHLNALVQELLATKLTQNSSASSDWTNILVETVMKNASKVNIPRSLALISADCEFVYQTIYALRRQPGTKYFYTFAYNGELSHFDARLPLLETNIRPKEAAHGAELLYLFATSHNKAMNEADKKFSKEYIKLLTNFAYTQNPTPKGVPADWKPWTNNEVLRMTSTGEFVMGDAEFYAKFDETYKLWKNIVPLS